VEGLSPSLNSSALDETVPMALCPRGAHGLNGLAVTGQVFASPRIS
jgi:hypothetical protein